MAILINKKIREKLADANHRVDEQEIIECFANRTAGFLTDSREEHKTDPETLWFVAETDYGRKIKIMFVPNAGNIYIKSAYPATEQIQRIYSAKARGENHD